MNQANFSGGGCAADWVLVHIAARCIERSPRSVRRYIKEGTLTAVRRGKRAWLVRRSDLRAAMYSGRTS